MGALLLSWPGVVVSTETAEMSLIGESEFALVKLQSVEFEIENSEFDRAELCFEVVGRFEHDGLPVSESRLGKAEALRESFLSLEHPGGIGYGGTVGRIGLNDLRVDDDDFFDLVIEYRCSILVGR